METVTLYNRATVTLFQHLTAALKLCYKEKHWAKPGADPASQVRGTISVIFGSQVSLLVHYCKRDDILYTSQHCCGKTTEHKTVLYRECCFPNCTKSWWIKLLS